MKSSKSSKITVAVIIFVLLLGYLLLGYLDDNGPTGGSESAVTPEKGPEAIIKGRVVDAQGNGVSGVRVRCWYMMREDIPVEMRHIERTDSEGRYELRVSGNFSTWAFQVYGVRAGGKASTFAESAEFNVKFGEITWVKDLVVRPTGNSCKGRLVYEDGRPAAGLTYGYVSESFSPIDDSNPPKINDKGEFLIEHLLSDELFSFYVFPKENTMCVWKRLDPNSRELEFTLKASEYIELPADWLSGGFTHLAIARSTCFAKDSRIQFELPDLNGNMVSLTDERFKGKALMVNLFGSWCGSCMIEIPYLVEFKNKYGPAGLEIIGIGFEAGSKEQQVETIKRVAEQKGINYPLLVGGANEKGVPMGVISGLKHFTGYPATLYIDRQGKVKHIQEGFWVHTEPHKEWTLKQVDEHIRSVLGEEL